MSQRLLARLVVLGLALPGALAAELLAQEAGDWELSGVARMDTVRGEPSIRLASGRAIRRDVSFRDGTIEFDVAFTAERSFVYVEFRMASDDDHEEFYFRPHKSGLPDAVQYTPVFGGASQWQLFHGEGGTAAEVLPHEGWVHVRIEVRGRRAEVYVGDAAEPSMVVDRLARDPVAGPVAVSAFRVGPPEREDLVAAFRNVRIEAVEPVEATAEAPIEDEGLVRTWRVAAPFDAGSPPWDALPAQLQSSAGWRVLETEPGGLLMLQRHFTRRPGRQTTAAKLTIRSDAARRVPLDLGYSDAVTVFLNGQPLFSADDGYSFDAPRRDGLIGLDQARLHLPLAAGENELAILVTDTFGGWGLVARLPARGGLRIDSGAEALQGEPGG